MQNSTTWMNHQLDNISYHGGNAYLDSGNKKIR